MGGVRVCGLVVVDTKLLDPCGWCRSGWIVVGTDLFDPPWVVWEWLAGWLLYYTWVMLWWLVRRGFYKHVVGAWVWVLQTVVGARRGGCTFCGLCRSGCGWLGEVRVLTWTFCGLCRERLWVAGRGGCTFCGLCRSGCGWLGEVRVLTWTFCGLRRSDCGWIG